MKTLIISGAGILAGTHLYNRLVNKVVGLNRFHLDSEFPEIVLYNHPFASIRENGIIDKKLAKKEIKNIVKNFKTFDYVLLACNTFHLLDLGIKNLLPLPQSAIEEFDKNVNKKGLALCSFESRKNNLFAHKDIIYPSQEINELIDNVISKNIFKRNGYKKENFQLLNEFIKKENITHLIIGCTELSVMNWTQFVDIPVIDSAEVTVNKLVKNIEEKSYESI